MLAIPDADKNSKTSAPQNFTLGAEPGRFAAHGNVVEFELKTKPAKQFADCDAIQSYMKRIGAEWRALDTAVVRDEDRDGYGHDRVTIRFAADGSIKLTPKDQTSFEPTELEAALIRGEAATVLLPHPVPIPGQFKRDDIPWPVRKAYEEGRLYIFYDTERTRVMARERVEATEQHRKYFIPWTVWSDGLWQQREPGGPLPFWGMEALLMREPVAVFLHEGEKAAKFAATLGQHYLNHPWQEELCANAVHLGWIGGAKASYRSDWAGLRKVLDRKHVEKVIVVLDNDAQGLAAMTTIARNLFLPTYALRFPEEWAKGFDIADPFPADQWQLNAAGQARYIGPRFHDCLQAATWATDVRTIVTGEVGRPAKEIRARSAFAQQWAYVHKTGQFVNRHVRLLAYKKGEFNDATQPFADKIEGGLAKLLLDDWAIHCEFFAYRPGRAEFIPECGHRLYNRWRPTDIKRVAGDVQPFLDFIAQLLPVETERYEALRWFATLIARPAIRMKYSLLLFSEMQGVGKDTWTLIARMLVGKHNTSNPTAQHVIGSAFHEWLVDKRLVIVSEIYEGHNWRAYNTLQSLITTEKMTVNPKGIAAYEADIAAHFWLNSNSPHCLKIEDKDRRLLVPAVTETKWGKENFDAFYEWLYVDDGFGKIFDWCHTFNNYVTAGEEAPSTEARNTMIAASRSQIYTEAAELAETFAAVKNPQVITYRLITSMLAETIQREKQYERINAK